MPRFPRPRFTLGRLMVAVAIAGIALGGLAALGRHRAILARAERYRALASWYSGVAMLDRDDASKWDLIASEKRKIPDPYPHYTLKDAADRAASSRKKASYHKTLEAKYERAALNPWSPVDPDPPTPD